MMKSVSQFQRVATAAVMIVGISLHATSSIAGSMSLTISGFSAPIEILGFSTGVSSFVSGGGATLTSFQDASFSAPESAASPLEYSKLTRGLHLASAQLQVLSSTTAQPISDWTFTDVVVSNIQFSRASGSNSSASTYFGLLYNKVAYRVFAADGSVAQQMCWDLVLKVAC